jgi:uncharacterized protein YukE
MATMLETLKKVIERGSVGNRWFKVNLHLHGEGNNPTEIVKEAPKAEVDLIAITDHQTFQYYDAIASAAKSPGRPLTVFPGMEITAHEGPHLLAIFPADYSSHQRTLLMGWLEINPPADTKVASKKKVADIFRKIEEERGIVVTPHPYAEDIGLLDGARKLSTKIDWLESGHVRLIQTGEDKVKYLDYDESANWINRYVLASARPEDIQSSTYSLAPFNRSDAHLPSEIREECSWFRMNERNVEGLKQVACEPHTRIRRSAPVEPEHDCLLHMRVTGGYCDGQTFDFNDGLNCIVGQNYAGKSAVFDFIRFVLAQDEMAPQESRDRLLLRLNGILGPDGVVELYLRLKGSYFVVRRVFRPVLSEVGPDMKIAGCSEKSQSFRFDPLQNKLIPVAGFGFPIEVYEQHRIYRLRDDVSRQLDMLDDFADLQELKQKRDDIIGKLGDSARKLTPLTEERERLSAEVANLETLKQELKEKEKLLPGEEEQRWAKTVEVVELYETAVTELEGSAAAIRGGEEDGIFVESKRELQQLFGQEVPRFDPTEMVHADLLSEWQAALQAALDEIEQARERILSAIQTLSDRVENIRSRWEGKRGEREREVNQQLANAGVESPAEITSRVSSLRTQINAIENVKQPRLTEVQKQIDGKEKERDDLLQRLEQSDLEIYAKRRKKAEELTDALGGQIKISLKPAGDKTEFTRILNELYDRIASSERKIYNRESQLANVVKAISPLRLAEALKKGGAVHTDDGKDTTLQELCQITPNTQNVLCAIAHNVALLNRLQTVMVPDVPEILVRRRGESEYADLRTGLSPGEQSAGILTLALETRTRPLLLDQPEDELGYSYVVHLIVPKVLQAKFMRQLLVITHNANIPVLGDADYVTKMENRQRPETGRACVVTRAGCFESSAITKALVELEGGEQAFRFRQHRYALPR